MLRQRVEQARLRFEPRIAVIGAPAGDASDEGLTFLPMAPPLAVAANVARLSTLPLQTWLYYSEKARSGVLQLADGCAAVYVDMLRLAPLASGLPRQLALIIDYDDLLSERYRRVAGKDYDVMGFLARRVGPLAGVTRAFATPLLRAEARRAGRYEQAMLARADLVLLTSPREASSVMREGAFVIGAPPPGERLIFLGNMRYAENVVTLRALAEAAAWRRTTRRRRDRSRRRLRPGAASAVRCAPLPLFGPRR